jgi:acyl-CoA synthetase (AMP-forming)/AMP-acid ligase II
LGLSPLPCGEGEARRGIMTIGNIVSRNAIRFPDREALVYEDIRYTWTQLNERVNRLAHAFLSLGLKPGDKVAMLSENVPAMVEANYALAKIGVVYFPVKTRLFPQDVRHLIDLSDASVLLFHEEFIPMVEQIRPGLRKIRTFIQVGGETQAYAVDYDAFVGEGEAREPGVEVASDDLYIFLCTGGTTGVSKLAMLTHANALWAVYTTIGNMNLTEKDAGLQVLPLFHVIINNCLNSLMAAGAKVVLQHRFDAVEYMRNVHKEKVTVAMVVPPFLFSWIMAVPEAIAYDITHVRAFATAAASFPRDLKESVRKYMPKAQIFYSYGLTEAGGGTVTVLPPSRLMDKDGSIGVVSTILDYRIVDSQGRPVRQGEAGELLLKGPCIVPGYYRREDETKITFERGWLHTGDVVREDEDGFLYFVDRWKDMIKTGGENVFAKEVEDALLTHPKIQEIAVFGLPDPKWGEKIHAAVVLKPGAKATEEELLAYAKETLPGYKRPKVFRFLDALPRNPSGKVLKYKLRENSAA